MTNPVMYENVYAIGPAISGAVFPSFQYSGLFMFRDGWLGDGTEYTRYDVAYSLDSSGDPLEVAQDVPTTDVSSGARELLWYAGTDIVGTGTVNQPYQWLYTKPATTENWSYKFTVAGNETVNTGLLVQPLTKVSFYTLLNAANGDVWTMCPKDTTDSIVAVASGAGFVINFSHDGTDYVSDTELAFDTQYLIELDDQGVLKVNNVVQTLSAGSSYTYSSTDILFGSRGVDRHIDGYMWDVKFYNSAGLAAWHKCNEDRYDKFSPDSSGNGNHGEIINYSDTFRHVDTFGSELDVSGRTPWISGGVQYGLYGLFCGCACGADITPYPFITDQSDSYVDGIYTFTSKIGDLLRTNDFFTEGTYNEIKIVISITSGSVRVNLGTGSTISDTEAFVLSSSGEYTVRRVATSDKRYGIASTGGFTGTIEILHTIEVDSATGRAEFEGFKPANVTTRQDLLVANDGTAIFYLDSDGYLKLTDGTNTAVSPAALSVDTTYSFSSMWSGDSLKMWITMTSFNDYRSYLLDGTSAIEAENMPDAVGTNDFYLRASFRPSAISGTQRIIGNFSSTRFIVYINSSGQIVLKNGTSGPIIHTSTETVSAGADNTIEYTRTYGGTSVLTINDVDENVTDNTTYTGITYYVGGDYGAIGDPTDGLVGYIWDFYYECTAIDFGCWYKAIDTGTSTTIANNYTGKSSETGIVYGIADMGTFRVSGSFGYPVTSEDVKGTESDFTGTFPDIGNRLFYSYEETDLHRITDVYFDNKVID